MKTKKQFFRTGQFAKEAGVTKRTLRFYDRLGLLEPRHRSESGHRLYSDDDFVRLQQINWEPLIYVCFSCFLKDPEYSERFAKTVQLLLNHGANPNAFYVDKDDPYERKLSALYGVVGIANNAHVAKILLEAGADPNDGESLYHAAEFPRHEFLDLLYAHGVKINETPAFLHKLDFEDTKGESGFWSTGRIRILSKARRVIRRFTGQCLGGGLLPS